MTIDADTVMHRDALAAVDRLVDSGAYVGGGCHFVAERNSLGLTVTSPAPAIFCVRKWDRFGDWYFTRMPAAARRARNPRDCDVRLIDEYFYDYHP